MQEAGMRGAEDRGPLKVALLGCGVVGSQVYRLLTEQSADLKARALANGALAVLDKPVDPVAMERWLSVALDSP